MSTGRWARRLVGMLLIVSASAAGCDFGPSGPGAIEIRVSGRGLGGAVVEVAPGLKEIGHAIHLAYGLC